MVFYVHSLTEEFIQTCICGWMENVQFKINQKKPRTQPQNKTGVHPTSQQLKASNPLTKCIVSEWDLKISGLSGQ